MRSDAHFSVVIIGGGFCGVLTMINLIEKSTGKTSITIINKGYPLARGVAYKTYSEKHLLNVEARNMSAFPDKPDHFAPTPVEKGYPGPGLIAQVMLAKYAD